MNGTSTPTTGNPLNQAGGGIFAMERSFGSEGKGVRVWYFPHNQAQSLPSDLRKESSSINPDNWGIPAAHLPIESCHADFGPHKIVFDITLCGAWAGQSYNQSGCAKTFNSCSYQVGYNGSSFGQAYWEVQSVKLFTSGGEKKMNAAISSHKGSPTNAAAPSKRRHSLLNRSRMVAGAVTTWMLFK